MDLTKLEDEDNRCQQMAVFELHRHDAAHRVKVFLKILLQLRLPRSGGPRILRSNYGA